MAVNVTNEDPASLVSRLLIKASLWSFVAGAKYGTARAVRFAPSYILSILDNSVETVEERKGRGGEKKKSSTMLVRWLFAIQRKRGFSNLRPIKDSIAPRFSQRAPAILVFAFSTSKRRR